MSLWNRGIERSKEVKRSEDLCKKRDELLKKWPGMMEAWEKEDSGPVRKAAEELSIVLNMQNSSRILQARETLKKAIWRRDDLKERLDCQISEVNAEIEGLNSPVIFEKVAEWQKDLSLLRSKKVVEVTERWTNPETGRRVKYTTNIGQIDQAKEKLFAAISCLKGMRQNRLSEIQEFIKKTETELQAIDFSTMKDAGEVAEWKYLEIAEEPGTIVYTTARLISGPRPGQNRIEKDFNLPVREMK